jgi:hypothetical protein
MHQVLSSLLPPDHLQDSFSRIFAYLDQNLPELFIAATIGNPPSKPPTFAFPTTDEGKTRLLLEVEMTIKNLNELPGVRPWEFTAMSVLEQELDYKLRPKGDELSIPQNDPKAEQPTDHKPTSTPSPLSDQAENDASPKASPPTCNEENGASPIVEASIRNHNGTADHSDAMPPTGDNGSTDKSPIEATQVASKEGTNAGEGQNDLPKNAGSHAEGINGDGSH